MLWDRDKRALQERHSEARKATGILSDDIKYKPPEEWQTRFDKLGSNDENVLAALLDECESELKLNRRYQEKKQSMDTLTEEIAQLREDREAALKETTISNQTLYFLLCNTIQFKEMLTVVGNLILMFPVTVIFLLLMACIVIYVRLIKC